MASVNKVILVGNLGRDPEVRTFPNGDRIANVTIATTDKWRDKQTNEPREATEWHRIQFTGRLAEIVEQYLRKGSQVYVEGSLRTRKWTDKDGIERYTTEIRADEMKMLGSRQGTGAPPSGDDDGFDSGPGNNYPPRQPPASRPVPARPAPTPIASPRPGSNFDATDDDIPF